MQQPVRNTVRKIIGVLDGQPTRVRGQSLLEMAFTFPLLILMILSLVEVGFAANNYLILMDVVRGAGRAAVNLDPVYWDRTTHPSYDARNYNRLDCDTNSSDHFQLMGNNVTVYDPDRTDTRSGGAGDPLDGLGYTIGNEGSYGFFDEAACQVTKSMQPLVFNDTDAGKDDIVISAISYVTMDYTGQSFTQGAKYNNADGPGTHGNVWVTVTGRWPKENRYCASYSGSTLVEGDARDPFDYMRNDFNVAWHNGTTADTGWSGNITEGDPVGSTGLLDPTTQSQGVRGFVFAGKAKPSATCYGSTFTVQEIEQRLNLNGAVWNKFAPNGGLVIVEVFWQHHPLFLGPIFQGFTGNPVDDPVLWVWGWFPVPGIEATATP